MKQMLRSFHCLRFYPCSCCTKSPPGFLFSTWRMSLSCRQHNMVLNQEACLLTTSSSSLVMFRLQESYIITELNRRFFIFKMRTQPKKYNQCRFRRSMTYLIHISFILKTMNDGSRMFYHGEKNIREKNL